MRECDMWKSAMNAYLDGGWDGLWLYLNRLCRDYGLEDSKAWEIACAVKKDAEVCADECGE